MFSKKDYLIEKSFLELYPDRAFNYKPSVIYSGRIKDYGGHILLDHNKLTVKLNRKWFSISEEIQMGFIQELMLRLWKIKGKFTTLNIDLYHNFVKNLHLAIPKHRSHPILERSFNRINERYFLGLVERPNLVWTNATRVFGTYDYKADTVSISKMLLNEDPVLLDYVMYHEVLHKQRKFVRSGSKTLYHDRKFKRLEKVFENQEEMERRLKGVGYKKHLFVEEKNKIEAKKRKVQPKSPKPQQSFLSGLVESIKNSLN